MGYGVVEYKRSVPSAVFWFRIEPILKLTDVWRDLREPMGLLRGTSRLFALFGLHGGFT